MFLAVGFGRPTQALSGVVLIFVRYRSHDVVPDHTRNFFGRFNAEQFTEFRRAAASLTAREKMSLCVTCEGARH